MPIRLLIADDHGLIRDGIRAVCNREVDFQIVAEVGDGTEAVDRAREVEADVAVVDIQMPGMTGLQAARGILRACPATRIIILTMHDDAGSVRAAIAAGCSGFVSKTAIGRELVTAIRHVNAGGSYLNVSLVGSNLIDVVAPNNKGPSKSNVVRGPLSRREAEVLALLARGYTNQEIGKSLFLSDKTIGTYRSRIADKLGLKSRADMVRYAMATGLLSLDKPPTDDDETSS